MGLSYLWSQGDERSRDSGLSGYCLAGNTMAMEISAETGEAAGLSGPSTGADYTIDHADIRLSEMTALFEKSLASIFSHEMMHALGFTGHYSGSTCRLMSPKTCGSHITVNEERLIQMLYATDLPSGVGESEIRAYFLSNPPNF